MNSIIRMLFGSPSKAPENMGLSRSSSQTSTNSTSSTRSSWSFLSFFSNHSKESADISLTKKVIEEVFTPLEKVESELRAIPSSKKALHTTQEKTVDLSKTYFELKTKAYEFTRKDSNLSRHLPTLVKASKINKILENHPEIALYLDNKTDILNENDSQALQEIYSLSQDRLLREYLGYDVSETSFVLQQYQGILDEVLGSNKRQLHKAMEKLFTHEVGTSTAINKSLISQQRTSFSQLLLQSVSLHETNDSLKNEKTKLGTRQLEISVQIKKLSLQAQPNTKQQQNLTEENTKIPLQLAEIQFKIDSLKPAVELTQKILSFLKADFQTTTTDTLDKYNEFKTYLKKEFPGLAGKIEELQSQEKDHFLIKVFSRIYGPTPVLRQSIENTLLHSITIGQKFSPAGYDEHILETRDFKESDYESYLSTLRNKKLMVNQSIEKTPFEQLFDSYASKPDTQKDSLIDQINKDIKRGMIIRVDERQYHSGENIYTYLTVTKKKSPEEALRLMSVLQQSGTDYSNKVVKKMFLGSDQKQELFEENKIRIAHNPSGVDPVEIDLDLSNENSPIVYVESTHIVQQLSEERIRMKVVTIIEKTLALHFIDVGSRQNRDQFI